MSFAARLNLIICGGSVGFARICCTGIPAAGMLKFAMVSEQTFTVAGPRNELYCRLVAFPTHLQVFVSRVSVSRVASRDVTSGADQS